jgi:tetratricopeptide (TPR) repeat protein
MTEPKGNRWTPHNPLGVIALFVFLIETVATVSLHAVAEKPFAAVLVWFIVLYPIAIAASFFLLLWFKREALFGPMDFTDQGEFSRLLQKVERIEVKQEAVGIVDRGAGSEGVEEILRTVDRLLHLDDPWSVIDIGRVFLRRKEYEKSLKVFEHIKSKIEPSNESYYKLLANLAYSQIGLNRNEEAIENLLQIKKMKRGREFFLWHALALAYAYLKTGDIEQCKRWIEYVRKNGAETLDLSFFVRLYPEMATQIRSLADELP